jgi:hypothetical protein
MADMHLTQAEANALIAMEKHRVNSDSWEYPSFGGSIRIPLSSADKREDFYFDIRRGKIDLLKGTYQNRARNVVVLVRLDFGGQPHRNPDEEEIASPHLHLFREGYGDKWAMSVPANDFPRMSDLSQTLNDFMRFCNIVQPPFIQRGLFV